MNPISRGFRNAFRNSIRTLSIVAILGLSIGLSLTMLIAQRAVENKIKSVKSAIGNTIDISPAGFNPGSQANNALTVTALEKVKTLPHVTGVTETLQDRLPTTGSSAPMFGRFDSSSDNGSTTSLSSPITIDTEGGGGGGFGGRFFVSGGDGGSLPANFSLPISFLGSTDPTQVSGVSVSLTSGKAIDGSADTNNALVSSQMASKNNLTVGSTFTAYNATLTVGGIFTTNNRTAQGTVVIALPTLQRLSGQSGVVTSAVATADSLDNLSGATSAIEKTLGSSADVVSAQQQADNTVAPLNSVKTVATYSVIGAVVAGGVIILLTMVMIVRERQKEIGVVKAIGGGNLRIISEFMTESFTLAVLGAVLGLALGVLGGQPVTKLLVTNSTTSSSSAPAAFVPGPPNGGGFAANRPAGGGFGGAFRGGFRRNTAVQSFNNIKAQIGWSILLDGFGAAALIAVIGSALSAGMIAKVRPATIMRSE